MIPKPAAAPSKLVKKVKELQMFFLVPAAIQAESLNMNTPFVSEVSSLAKHV